MAMFRGKRVPKGTKILKPVRPNLGIEARYRRDLTAMIKEMHDDVSAAILAEYEDNAPRIAQDALPASALQAVIRRMVKRWQKNFDEGAEKLADWFTEDVASRSQATLRKILRDAGFSVHFQPTQAMRDIMQATVQQNVSLIKSIPQQYLGQVEQLVMRSVQSGRDLHQLTEDLLKRYDITRKRAELIALDQNNKATSAFTRARQEEVGIKKAIWVHSHAGKEPRRTHVKMDGKQYVVTEGMWDSAEQEYVWPGQLIRCKCFSRPVVKGFS